MTLLFIQGCESCDECSSKSLCNAAPDGCEWCDDWNMCVSNLEEECSGLRMFDNNNQIPTECPVDAYINLSSTNSPTKSPSNHDHDENHTMTDFVSVSRSTTGQHKKRFNVSNNVEIIERNNADNTFFSIGPFDFSETTFFIAMGVVFVVVLLCCIILILLCCFCCPKEKYINKQQNELQMCGVPSKNTSIQRMANNDDNNINANDNKSNNEKSSSDSFDADHMNNDYDYNYNHDRDASLEIVFKDLEQDAHDNDVTYTVALSNVHSKVGNWDAPIDAIATKNDNTINISINTSANSIDNHNDVLNNGVENLYDQDGITVEGQADVHIANESKTDCMAKGGTIPNTSISGIMSSHKINSNMQTSSTNTNDNSGELNYQEWTQKQVLIWFKNVLLDNNFEKHTVLSFLKELKTKCVTGKTLEQLKKTHEVLMTFQSQFSTNNQAFALWLAVQTAIDDLGATQQ